MVYNEINKQYIYTHYIQGWPIKNGIIIKYVYYKKYQVDIFSLKTILLLLFNFQTHFGDEWTIKCSQLHVSIFKKYFCAIEEFRNYNRKYQFRFLYLENYGSFWRWPRLRTHSSILRVLLGFSPQKIVLKFYVQIVRSLPRSSNVYQILKGAHHYKKRKTDNSLTTSESIASYQNNNLRRRSPRSWNQGLGYIVCVINGLKVPFSLVVLYNILHNIIRLSTSKTFKR